MSQRLFWQQFPSVSSVCRQTGVWVSYYGYRDALWNFLAISNNVTESLLINAPTHSKLNWKDGSHAHLKIHLKIINNILVPIYTHVQTLQHPHNNLISSETMTNHTFASSLLWALMEKCLNWVDMSPSSQYCYFKYKSFLFSYLYLHIWCWSNQKVTQSNKVTIQ